MTDNNLPFEQLVPNLRVFLTREYGNHPFAPLPAGTKGTVIEVDEATGRVEVKLDEHHSQFNDFNNCLQVGPESFGINEDGTYPLTSA